MLLSITVLTPLLGALVQLVMPADTTLQVQRIKVLGLVVSLITFGLTILVWASYDIGVSGYQLTSYSTVGFAAIHLGVDGLSVYYLVLTGLLTPICLLASWSNVTHGVRLYNALQLITCGLLLAVFVQLDMLLFYVSFEAVLIPLFFVVGRWGGSPSRVRSAMLLFLYTLGGSLFMLLAIVGLYGHTGTLDMTILHNISIDPIVQRLLWLSFGIALAIKTPVVPVHVWLPRAHADAPLAGSMVLAGTVLKLATYGVLRIMVPILPDASFYYGPLVQTVAVVSIIYSSLATLRQSDFKALVAYSSVAHMGVVLVGLFSNTVLGITGGIFLSLAHGLVSPALFMLVGGVLYDRFHSRSISYYRGLASLMPLFSIVFFIMTCANMGTPMTMNWVGEFMALAGTYQSSVVAGILASTGIVLSACYSIWLWGRLNAGSYSPYLSSTVDLTRREWAVLLPLLVLTIVLGVVPGVLLDSIGSSVSALIYEVLVP
jgi:NADH-ubiquinone oxidoreductase chain 4